MKKIILATLLFLFPAVLSACGSQDTYRVGASPVPHADILREAQELIDEEFQFEIVEFSDYVLPNTALHEGDIVANFFQHIPYLELQIDEHGYDFESVGGVHIEPIGLYSKVHDSLETLPESLEIIISNSPSDRPRLLGVLEDANLIEIKEETTDADITNASLNGLNDLFESDKDITFKEVSPQQLFSNYDNESGDLVLINGNFALDHGLEPLNDALALESTDSPYVNVLVVRSEDVDDPFIQALYEILSSEEIADWIEEEYKGSVILAN